MSHPNSLFKYASFGPRLIEQLCTGEVYYANPANFNDPLDCQPVVIGDHETAELRELLGQMIFKRAGDTFDRASKQLRLKRAVAAERRQMLLPKVVHELLGEIEYGATNPDYEDQKVSLKFMLTKAIEDELRRSYDTGVL